MSATMTSFEKLIKHVAQDAKTFGYQRKGNILYLKENGNYGLIQFQKGKTSISPKGAFTINLAVFSQQLWNFFHEPISDVPDPAMAQWRIRIGSILAEKKDHWWPIEDEAQMAM